MKFVTHPILLITVFLLIHIDGDAVSGFYIQFLLGGNIMIKQFSVLGIAGVAIIILNLLTPRNQPKIKSVINIVGALLMIMSLTIFFTGDAYGYYSQTFYHLIPMLILGVFIILTVVFCAMQIKILFK